MKGETRKKLSELALRPSKGKGQNFAVDPDLINSIIEFETPPLGSKIVEIGPGLGALTKELSKFGRTSVIEIEPSLSAELRKKYSDIEVINKDIRDVDLSIFGQDLYVFGNVPYSISTDIIFHLIDNRRSIKRAILLLQKEFAERLASSPGSRSYGTISVTSSLWVDFSLGPEFGGEMFFPKTKVSSRLIRLDFLPEVRFAVSDLSWFRKVVDASFFSRRKKLANSLRSSGIFQGYDIKNLLSSLAINPDRRAETLSLEEFVKLANSTYTLKAKP